MDKDQLPKYAKEGLTSDQVGELIAAGKVNAPVKSLTRTKRQILLQNTVTLFNVLNILIAILVATTGRYANLWFLGPVLFNTVIGVVQELNAKRRVDKLSLIGQQKIQTKRNGKDVLIPQDDLVEGDLITVKRGNALPADGVIVSAKGLSVDESALTGESRSIYKKPGDKALSGSLVNAGSAQILLTAVGHDSFLAKLSLEAKTEKHRNSELLDLINQIIRVLTYIIVPLGLVLFTSGFMRRGQLNQAILGASTAVIGMIPEGLVVLTSVALAVGAANLSRKQVLVRSLNSLEALARIDILALDKTGTITTGNLAINEVLPLNNFTQDEVMRRAKGIVLATGDDNATATVIEKYQVTTGENKPVEVLPFSSELKMSGSSFSDDPDHFWVMGAPEFVMAHRDWDASTQQAISDAAKNGYRTILLARGQGKIADVADTLLTPVGWLKIADEIRPTAKQTFDYLKTQQISLRVISGDNPATVSNVAQRAGIKDAQYYVDMSEQGEEVDFDKLVAENRVFGRVSPTQKRSLVKAMQRAGHTVGMTGDGVNDVLALKQSDCAIAVAGGNDASQSVADFVLLDGKFDTMIDILNEGRRVINNIERVASMYLNKTIYSILLAVIFIFVNAAYPFHLSQLSPVTALTVGIPSFFLALEPDFRPPVGRFMRNVLQVALPAALSVVTFTIFLTIMNRHFALPFDVTSTLVTFLISIIGVITLFYLSRPLNRERYVLLGLVTLAVFVAYIFCGKPFELISIFDIDLIVWWVPLTLATYPLFFAYRELISWFLLRDSD